MIVEVDFRPLVSVSGEVAQMFGAVGGARRQPLGVLNFFLLFPLRCRPDVLGVGRDGERHLEHGGGIAGYGSRRVQEMRVKKTQFWIAFVSQHAGLAETPDPV